MTSESITATRRGSGPGGTGIPHHPHRRPGRRLTGVLCCPVGRLSQYEGNGQREASLASLCLFRLLGLAFAHAGRQARPGPEVVPQVHPRKTVPS